MALIDIDRHILLEITGFTEEIKRECGQFECYWRQVVEVRDKTDALLFHAKPTRKRQAALMKLKNQIFTATNRGERSIRRSQRNIAKLEALLIHLVSEIKTIDTGRGLETDANWRGNKKIEKEKGRQLVRDKHSKPNWEHHHVEGRGKRRRFKENPRRDSDSC